MPRLWADSRALQRAAERWLSVLEEHLPAADATATREIIGTLPALFGHRAPVVCHGDFGPQNVLVIGERVSGLIDLEDVRIGDALLDVAWWAWLVRAHTPAAFTKTWPGFLRAAGVDADEDSFQDRIICLLVLRLLETAEAFRHSAPAKYPSWGRRLSQTLQWAVVPLT